MITKLLRSLLTLVAVFSFCAGTALAQQTGTIKGTVTNKKSGKPIVSANVYINKLNTGAATDAKGHFTINDVPYGSYKMRVSYIGFANKTVTVNVNKGTVTVNVALSRSVAKLSNIVVTAYGQKQQEQNLTISTQTVSPKDLTNAANSNLLESLSGRVSGLQVQSNGGTGSSTKIVLRGHSSLQGSNQALIVVDGVPYANVRYNPPTAANPHNNGGGATSGFFGFDFGNTGTDLNPEVIKSVNVLKSAAASALYGSRGSNGAIIIQTKKGTPGQKTQVTFSTSGGFGTMLKNTFPKYQRQYGAGYGVNHFFTFKNPFGSSPAKIKATRFRADASFGPAFNPDSMVYQWDSFYPGSPNYGKKEPYTAAPKGHGPASFFRTPINIKNNFQVNGAISNGGYYSLGYSQSFNRASVPNGKLNTNQVDFAAGYNISSKLEAQGHFYYIRHHSRALPQRGYDSYLSSFRQWMETNVDYTKLKAAYFKTHQNWTWNPNASDLSTPFYWDNPYYDQYQNYPTNDRNRFRGQIALKYNIAKWFNITARAAEDNVQAEIQQRTNVNSAYPPVARYNRFNGDYKEYNFYLLGHYNKQISQSIKINGVLGGQARRDITNNIDARTRGGLVVPGLFSLQNSKANIPFPYENYSNMAVNSEYASFNLTYNNYINLSLTGRRDKSSTLPKNNNVYYYPSASASFTFSHFIHSNAFSLGKIRGSYAAVGHSAPPLVLHNTLSRTSFGGSVVYSLPTQKRNSHLVPEKKKEWDIGLTLGFFNNRVKLDGSYYKNNTLNQSVPVPTSTASGYLAQFINAGNIQNTGIELTLNARPVVSHNFNWKFTVNWSHNQNKIKSLAPGVYYYQFINPQGGGVQIGATAPNPKHPNRPAEYGAIRGYDYVYKNGKRVVNPKTGFYESTPGANHVIGNVQPNWTGGISNTINYKNFSLNFLIGVRAGGDIFSLDQWYGQGTGIYANEVGNNAKGNPKRDPVSKGGGVLLKGVNPDGSKNTTYANYFLSQGFWTNPSARYVYDASYVKLRQAGLSYNLPKTLVNKMGLVTGATFSVQGRNLWIIYKNLPYADPSATVTNANIQSGYQGGNMPTFRNITFKIELHF